MTAKRSALNRSARLGLAALVMFWMLLTLDIVWPWVSGLGNRPAEVESPTPSGANYLVIAPEALAKVASSWAEYRTSTGYHAQVLLLAPAQAKPAVIRELIQKVRAESEPSYPLFVLLIGHAHPASSHPGAFLPSAYFSVDTSRFPGYGPDPIPSDDVYAGDVLSGTSDEAHRILIGRIPIRTESEGLLLLERTRRYEQTPPVGEGRARVELVSSNAGFGPQYDPIFEWALRTLMEKDLPDEYAWHRLYGNAQSPYSYPSELFPQEVARRFGSGALALVYVGHGQPELLGWALSPDGTGGRIFGIEDAPLLQHANASLGIFTACSAGKYDLRGDDLSVVEAVFLTPGGPVATYSSSAWINGMANGRLLIDLLEVLLIDKPLTLGKWAEITEAGSEQIRSPMLLAEIMKILIPRFSGVYHGKPVLSASDAKQELAIQHATYNLFGDPALRIAYPEPGIEISAVKAWVLPENSLSVSGTSKLRTGQAVSISLQAHSGVPGSEDSPAIGTIERYRQQNNLMLASKSAYVGPDGSFSGTLAIPSGTPAGKYILRVVSVGDNNTYVAAHPIYIGWPAITEMLSSVVFWWLVIGAMLLVRILRASARSHDEDLDDRASRPSLNLVVLRTEAGGAGLRDDAGRLLEAR